jgi:hypothetical protein
MALSRRGLINIIGWGVITAAILKLSDLPGEFEHAFCGPWG